MPKRPPSHRPHQGPVPGGEAKVLEGRASSSKRGYDSTWRKLRLIHLNEEPYCRFCQRAGRLTVACVVDHIKAHKGDRELLLDPSNLQSLCKPCHDSTKQRMERGRAIRRIGADGIPITDTDT